MKLRVTTAVLLCFAVAGCSPKSADKRNGSMEFSDEKVRVDLMAPPADAGAMPDKNISEAVQRVPGAATDPAAQISVPLLAYDYTYRFTAPVNGVDALVAADQAACEKAGVAQCQMISLSANNNPDAGYVNKTLELRATPQWIKTWQGGIDAGLKKAHGRISQQDVTSEDLSLQIVDTEAHIKNKEALRDRLVAIIKGNSGKISDLVEAETQLSNVQAEIDSSRSSLAVMQKRVATSHLTLTYESEAAAASNSAFSPVSDAFRDILRNMMTMFGAIIQMLSFLIPLAIVVGPVVWIILNWQRKRKAAKAAAVTPDKPA